MVKKTLFAVAFSVVATSGYAQVFSLTAGNAVLSGDASQFYFADTYRVLGIDQLFGLTYGLSVNGGAVQTLDQIGFSSLTVLNPSAVRIMFENTDVRVQLNLSLTGAGMASGLSQQLRLTNKTSSNMNYRLYQYNDYNLHGSPGGDYVERIASNQMYQEEGLASAMFSGVNPVPGRSQLGFFPSTLNNVLAGTNLNTVAGSGIGDNLTGDVSFAFQWDGRIRPGGLHVRGVLTDVEAVPEPATIAGVGLALLALARRRRSK